MYRYKYRKQSGGTLPGTMFGNLNMDSLMSGLGSALQGFSNEPALQNAFSQSGDLFKGFQSMLSSNNVEMDNVSQMKPIFDLFSIFSQSGGMFQDGGNVENAKITPKSRKRLKKEYSAFAKGIEEFFVNPEIESKKASAINEFNTQREQEDTELYKIIPGYRNVPLRVMKKGGRISKKKAKYQAGGTTQDSLSLYKAMILQQNLSDQILSNEKEAYDYLMSTYKEGLSNKEKADYFKQFYRKLKNGINLDYNLSDEIHSSNYDGAVEIFKQINELYPQGPGIHKMPKGSENDLYYGKSFDELKKDMDYYTRSKEYLEEKAEYGKDYLKLMEDYKKLPWDEKVHIGQYVSSDIIHPKINAIGTYYDGLAYSPLYEYPKSLGNIPDELKNENIENMLRPKTPPRPPRPQINVPQIPGIQPQPLQVDPISLIPKYRDISGTPISQKNYSNRLQRADTIETIKTGNKLNDRQRLVNFPASEAPEMTGNKLEVIRSNTGKPMYFEIDRKTNKRKEIDKKTYDILREQYKIGQPKTYQDGGETNNKQQGGSQKEVYSRTDGFKGNFLSFLASTPSRDDWYSKLRRLYSGDELDYPIKISDYKPSNSKDNNATYYSVTDDKIQKYLINLAKHIESGQYSSPEEIKKREKKKSRWTGPIKEIKSKSGNTIYNVPRFYTVSDKEDEGFFASNYNAPLAGLGNYQVSFGEDEKGKYISYYDLWDTESGAEFLGMGKPIEVYDRVYYEDNKKGNFQDGGKIPISSQGQYQYPGQPVIVPTQTGKITMDGVNSAILAIDESGRSYILPKNSGTHQLSPGNVLEIPLKPKSRTMRKTKKTDDKKGISTRLATKTVKNHNFLNKRETQRNKRGNIGLPFGGK